MRRALPLLSPVVLLLSLLLPAAAGAFSISLPADSAVKVDSPSRLAFRVTNTDTGEGLSRLALRFPNGYRVAAGSPPPGWTVEQGSGAAGESAEIVFRTADQAKCTGAIAPGSTLVFGVEVIALRSRSVTPDGLADAQAEQSCRGVTLAPPATSPTWKRLGLEATLGAGPPILGLGGVVTVTMTVTNLSTVELADVSALVGSSGTGGVSRLEGPTPATFTLAPAASGSLSWTARAASPGTLHFGGQAVAKDLTSPPTRSDPLFVGDLDVSLSVAPEQVPSSQDVQAQMTVTNRGPVRVRNVTPSVLAFEGTATASAPAGPTPSAHPALEPGESVTFAWNATLSGSPGDTYAFSGWAWAEAGAIVSQNARSNRGTLGGEDVAEETPKAGEDLLLGGGAAASDAGPAVAVGGGAAAAPSATLQFIGLNHNGSEALGTTFSGTTLRDLRILVAWQSLSGAHNQRLELVSPDGSLYQRVSAQFSGTPVETRLPVGGTWITQNSLFGAWRVDVFLDGQGSSIASGVFVLNP